MSAVAIPIVIISVLIAMNGVFVAAEFAIIAAPRTLVAREAERGTRAAQRVRAIHDSAELQNRYLATAQVGITIVSLGLGMYGEHALADLLMPLFEGLGQLAAPAAHTIATVAAIGLLTYVHVVVGEMVAKSIALQKPLTLAMLLDRPMYLLGLLFSPVVWLLNHLGNGVTQILGFRGGADTERTFTADELEYIVEESSNIGLLGISEKLIVENIFDLQERNVGQVMTPRTRIVGIPASATASEMLQLICAASKTRYPIYEEGLDNIKGVVHLKDIARRLEEARGEAFDIQPITRPATFVPESISIYDLLLRFRREKLQIAIAIDEYGGTAGIITLEDLIEEVVGEIQDEYDVEISPIERVSESLLRVRGDVILDEVNQHSGMNLQHPDANTVSGLVMAVLGRIPRPQDKIAYRGAVIEVESVERRAVQRALIYLPAKTGN